MLDKHVGQGGCREGTFLLCLQYSLLQASSQFLSQHDYTNPVDLTLNLASSCENRKIRLALTPLRVFGPRLAELLT